MPVGDGATVGTWSGSGGAVVAVVPSTFGVGVVEGWFVVFGGGDGRVSDADSGTGRRSR